MARRLAAAAQPEPKPSARDLRDSIAAAVAGMDWLAESDKVLVDLALNAARQIEEAEERRALLDEAYADARDPQTFKRLQKLEAMCDVTKTVGWLGPQIQGYLRDLGGTPASRKAMKGDQPIGGRLAALRAGTAKAPGLDASPAVD